MSPSTKSSMNTSQHPFIWAPSRPRFPPTCPLSFITRSTDRARALTQNQTRFPHTHIHYSTGNTKRRRQSLRRRRPRRAWVSFRHHHVCSDVGSMKSSALAPVKVTEIRLCITQRPVAARYTSVFVFVLSLASVSNNKRN